MALTRQQNFLGQQRVDVPHLRSLESAVANDFDLLAGNLLAARESMVVKGFEINVTGAFGAPATALTMKVAGGIAVHWGATEAGTLLMVPDNRADEVLNSGNPRVQGSFSSGVTNYVGIDYLRQADATTTDTTKFLSADTNQEVARSVPQARTLDYRIVITTSPFSLTPNVDPVAKVVTDTNGNVVTITDARNLMNRLGTGGDVPNPTAPYTWADSTRRENPNTYAPGDGITTNPFSGGDKLIVSMKDWMNAVMNTLWEAKSGEHWYSPTTRDGMKMVFAPDALLSNGLNFMFTGGNISWVSLRVIFENSPATFYNTILNNVAGIALAEGQCVYVDVVRTLAPAAIGIGGLIRSGSTVTATTSAPHGYVGTVTITLESSDTNFPSGEKVATVTGTSTFTYTESGASTSSTLATASSIPLVAQVGSLIALPTPTVPGSRIIFAYRLGGQIYARDYPFDIGRPLVNVATTTAVGVVQLNQDATHVATAVVSTVSVPYVPGIDANGGINILATTGVAVRGMGAGTNAGIQGTGGSGGGPGVQANGTGTGTGIQATGGSSGLGGIFTGGSGGAVGLQATATGDGAGPGVNARGSVTNATNPSNGLDGFGGSGAGGGVGVRGLGGASGTLGSATVGAGVGVLGIGRGTDAGVRGNGGGSNGTGVVGVGGSTDGIGVTGTGSGAGAGGDFTGPGDGTGSTDDAIVSHQNIKLAGSNSASGLHVGGFTNRLTPGSIAKAWGIIQLNGGATPSLTGYNFYNVQALSFNGNNIRVKLAAAFVDSNFCPQVVTNNVAGAWIAVPLIGVANDTFDIQVFVSTTGSVVNLGGAGVLSGQFFFTVFGYQ